MCRSIARRSIAAIVFALSLVPTGVLGQQGAHGTIIAASARKPAPAFNLADPSGKTTQLADYKGKVVLLNFWATECGGCKIEVPMLVDLQKTYVDKGFTIVGISADITYSHLSSPEQGWSQVKPFVASHNVNYPILMANDAVLLDYGAQGLPASLLIDKSGRVAATYIGIVDKGDVESNVKTLLAEPSIQLSARMSPATTAHAATSNPR